MGEVVPASVRAAEYFNNRVEYLFFPAFYAGSGLSWVVANQLKAYNQQSSLAIGSQNTLPPQRIGIRFIGFRGGFPSLDVCPADVPVHDFILCYYNIPHRYLVFRDNCGRL
jgi:hypothetical protein